MSKVFRLFSVALLLVLSAGPALANCDWNRIIWATEQRGERWVLYFGDTFSHYGTNAYLELWKAREIKLRMYGLFSCSQGQVVCRLFVIDDHYTPQAYFLPHDDVKPGKEITRAILEDLDANADGRLDFLILAGLRQGLYYGIRPDEKYADIYDPKYSDGVHLPHGNIFSYLNCRKTDLDPSEYKAPIFHPNSRKSVSGSR